MGSWPWLWPRIGSYCIPSCITRRPLTTYQISLKSKKLFVDGRTDIWDPLMLLNRLGNRWMKKPKGNQPPQEENWLLLSYWPTYYQNWKTLLKEFSTHIRSVTTSRREWNYCNMNQKTEVTLTLPGFLPTLARCTTSFLSPSCIPFSPAHAWKQHPL